MGSHPKSLAGSSRPRRGHGHAITACLLGLLSTAIGPAYPVARPARAVWRLSRRPHPFSCAGHVSAPGSGSSKCWPQMRTTNMPCSTVPVHALINTAQELQKRASKPLVRQRRVEHQDPCPHRGVGQPDGFLPDWRAGIGVGGGRSCAGWPRGFACRQGR
jgi:hypothetical protein